MCPLFIITDNFQFHGFLARKVITKVAYQLPRESSFLQHIYKSKFSSVMFVTLVYYSEFCDMYYF